MVEREKIQTRLQHKANTPSAPSAPLVLSCCAESEQNEPVSSQFQTRVRDVKQMVEFNIKLFLNFGVSVLLMCGSMCPMFNSQLKIYLVLFLAFR